MRRVVVVVALLGLGGCATVEREEPPRLSVVVDDVGAAGGDCGARVVPVRGARPEGTRVVAAIRVTADRPVALASLEQAALVPALRRCASGLSILRAEAKDGTDGYASIAAEAWDAALAAETPAMSTTPTVGP